jgi:Uma2 family endonuclease
MAIQAPRKLFSIDEYERMIETGILREDDHVELIRGEIVEMSPIGLEHITCVMRLNNLFLTQQLNRNLLLSVQNPIRVPSNSRPEPDVTVLKWRDDFYAGKHPSSEDVLLLIEVSDTTLADDRNVKMPLYAASGIPEMWIVNLPEGVIEVYANPAQGGYQYTRLAHRGESLPLPAGLVGAVQVDDILG